AALREGQHRLPARTVAGAPDHEPAVRASGARLHGRHQGGARAAHRRHRPDLQEARLRCGIRRLRIHGRGRHLRAGPRGRGPHLQTAGGAKDEAKRTAIERNVSVTPGINDATVRTLLRSHPDHAALARLAKTHGLEVPALRDTTRPLAELAAEVLEASYAKRVDLFTIDDLGETLRLDAVTVVRGQPGGRFRLKAMGGGGGRGQRICGDAARVPGLVREVLSEVKATGVGDNKNMLLELNVEQTRHNEIQILGNGEW